jgi:5-methylcytosine-specific restriction endonuclease McrA
LSILPALLFLSLLFLLLFPLPADARSKAAVNAFRKTHPCPATREIKGKCPGWQVDHIVPLKCGGADAPHNMQWLTVAAHKAKTRREARLCRKKPRKRRT